MSYRGAGWGGLSFLQKVADGRGKLKDVLKSNKSGKRPFANFGFQKKVRFYRQPLGNFEKSEVL